MSFCIGLILRSRKNALAALWAKQIALAGLFGASWFFIAPSKRYVGSDPWEHIHGSVPVGIVGVLADFHYDAGG